MSLNAYAVPAAEQKQVLDFIAKLDIRAIAVQVMQELFKALAMRFFLPAAGFRKSIISQHRPRLSANPS